MAGIVTETKRRLLIGKDIKEVQVPTNTLDTSLYLADLASVGATFNSSRIASELGALPAVVKQNASLALIADTYKTGAVYAINGDTKSLEELNFERGSAATYEDASGNIVLASANVPRINYRNGVLQGWLVEPASTNLLLDSGIDNGLGSFQSKSSEGLTAGASGFNLGSLLANSITISKGSETTYAYKSSSVPLINGNVYTFSFFCRLSDGSAPTSKDMGIMFSGSGSSKLISYGNGVYRYYFTGIIDSSMVTGRFGIYKQVSHSDKSITVSGFQLEEGSLTSYIPTTTAIATRLADKISTKRPTVVFNKNSMYVKTAEYSGVWFGDGVDGLEIEGRNLITSDSISIILATVDKTRYAREGIITITKDTEYGGIFIPASLLKPSKVYVISYKYKKINGTLVSFGGHTGYSWSNNETYVDGVYKGNHNTPNSGFIANDTNIHEVICYITTPSAITESDSFYIQPNRGNKTLVTVEVYDLKLEEGNKVTDWAPEPENYVKVDSNGNIEISYDGPIHIQQFSLISRELSQEEVG